MSVNVIQTIVASTVAPWREREPAGGSSNTAWRSGGKQEHTIFRDVALIGRAVHHLRGRRVNQASNQKNSLCLLPASYWLFSWFTRRSWWWTQYVPPKRRWTSIGQHDVRSQMIILYILDIGVSTSNPTQKYAPHLTQNIAAKWTVRACACVYFCKLRTFTGRKIHHVIMYHWLTNY
jgi:hypothetical protein